MGAYKIFKNALILNIKCFLGAKRPPSVYKLNNLWYYGGIDFANGKDFTNVNSHVKFERDTPIKE